MSKGSILVADDDTAIRTVLQRALSQAGYDVRVTGNATTLWKWVSQGYGDLVVTDVVMPDANAFDLLPKIKQQRPELPIIVMSAQNTLTTAVTAAERGAYEYLPKPFDLNELVAVVGRALAEPKREPQLQKPGPETDGTSLIGRSAAMQSIYRVLARLTQTDMTVLITGESGTGKELVARALHDYSKRNKHPFVAVNMAAIPRELIESELFGHERGAFTGAVAKSSGRFEQAEGGTLFLDEIGDMPMDAQTRLLRVLQEGEFTMVGGRTAIKTDVRVVAATHRDLRQLINQGIFREDLYFRLNVVPMKLPALRERIDDIPDLVHHFIQKTHKEEGIDLKTLEPDALALMKRYPWPGNVRELENFVKRLCALYSQDVITKDVVQGEINTLSADVTPPTQVDSEIDLSESIEQYLHQYFQKFGTDLPPDGLYNRMLHKLEYPLICTTLVATNGNQVRAAELLGLNRNTLRKKIKELDIKVVKSTIG